MKRIALADVHISNYCDTIDKNGYSIKLKSILDNLYYIAEYAQQQCIQYIDILGDLFNDKHIIYTDSFNHVFRFFQSYPDLRFYIISGNHDLSTNSSIQSSAIEPLKALKNVFVINEMYCEGNQMYVSYGPKMVDIITHQSPNHVNILLAHFGLNEAVLQTGISIVNDISIKELENKYQLVILGHYHKPQEIIRNDIKVYYCGNICHLSWSDKNEDKRFLVYDTESLSVESIGLPLQWKYIELQITDDMSMEEVEAVLNRAKELTHNPYCNVRIQNRICKDSQLYQQLSSQINKMSNGSKFDQVMIVENIQCEYNRGIHSGMHVKEILKKYIEYKQIPKDLEEKYINIGMDIITKSKD